MAIYYFVDSLVTLDTFVVKDICQSWEMSTETIYRWKGDLNAKACLDILFRKLYVFYIIGTVVFYDTDKAVNDPLSPAQVA